MLGWGCLMLIPEAEKRWTAELERRKQKIVEESQNRLNNFNAFHRSLLIFSYIFRVAPKLKRLPKRTRRRLKHRTLHLNKQKLKSEQSDTKVNVKDQKHILPFELFHNHKSRYAEKPVPKEIFGSYLSKLKQGI